MPLRGYLLEDTSRIFPTESAHPPCLKRARRGLQGWGQVWELKCWGSVIVMTARGWVRFPWKWRAQRHASQNTWCLKWWTNGKNHRSQCNFDVLDQTAVFARSYCGVDLRLCSFGITYKSSSKLKAWFLQHILMLCGLGETLLSTMVMSSIWFIFFERFWGFFFQKTMARMCTIQATSTSNGSNVFSYANPTLHKPPENLWSNESTWELYRYFRGKCREHQETKESDFKS